LRALAPEGMKLWRGFEIMLDVPAQDLTSPALSLGGSRAVLIEWPRGVFPPEATQELMRLRRAGLVPLLAHVERYRGVTPDVVAGWRELGVVMQTDATFLLAGGEMGALAQTILERGMVDVLASDNHGDRRGLGTARQWLEEMDAGEQATLLTAENSRRL